MWFERPNRAQSGRGDLNPRPLRPERSALTKLRHFPRPRVYPPAPLSGLLEPDGAVHGGFMNSLSALHTPLLASASLGPQTAGTRRTERLKSGGNEAW